MVKKRVSQRSLENLVHEGRPTVLEEKKTSHNVTVTPTGWAGVQRVSKSMECSSVSELIEQIGRGQISTEKKPSEEFRKNTSNGISRSDIVEVLSEFEERLLRNLDEKLKDFATHLAGWGALEDSPVRLADSHAPNRRLSVMNKARW